MTADGYLTILAAAGALAGVWLMVWPAMGDDDAPRWRILVPAVLAAALLLGWLARAEAGTRAMPSAAILTACEARLSDLAGDETHPERLAVCLEVGLRADRAGAPVALALGLGWHESRYRRVPRRMLGALQVSRSTFRRYCRGRRDCTPIEAGVRHLAHLLDKYGDAHRAVCVYNAGFEACHESWVAAVLAEARWFRRTLRRAGEGGPEA